MMQVCIGRGGKIVYYLTSRYYDPEIGRFISPDSINYLDPQSINVLNLYAYCGNNPIMNVDPSGNSFLGFLAFMAISYLLTTAASEVFGAQLVGGAMSIYGGASTIGLGISLLAFGPVGWIAGGLMLASSAVLIISGVAEIGEQFTGYNFVTDGFGMSAGLYNGLRIGASAISIIGSVAAPKYMTWSSNNRLASIQANPSSINNYKLWQIKTYGKYTTNYTVGTLTQGNSAGTGYKLTTTKDGGLISWSPGSSHHGNVLYWKVSSGSTGIHRFFYYTGIPF